jgi:hypothetical protein
MPRTENTANMSGKTGVRNCIRCTRQNKVIGGQAKTDFFMNILVITATAIGGEQNG